jgi:hypothetical protein
VLNAIPNMFPRNTCIAGVPKTLIERAAVDLLLVKRVNSNALRSVIHKAKCNSPFAVAVAYHCNPVIDSNVENRHDCTPTFWMIY